MNYTHRRQLFWNSLVIKGLMEYVRKHSFAVFGVYRIILGVLVLGYFAFQTLHA